MEDNRKYIQVLTDTLRKQVDTLQEVLTVTQEQSRIAAMPNLDESMLEETMNRKEILIARLNVLDDGFTSVYDRVRREILANKEAYKDELRTIQTMIQQCTDLGVEIRVLEQRNRDKMTQQFTNKHQQYSTKRTAATVASRYNKTMNGRGVAGAGFLDSKQ